MSDPQASAIEEEVAFFGNQGRQLAESRSIHAHVYSLGCTLDHLLSFMQQDSNRNVRDESSTVQLDEKQRLWKIVKGIRSMLYEPQV